jgi:FixJ family two-component response regulator
VVPQVWLIREAELPKKPLILIVDDDDAPRNAIKGLMRALGFRAEAFETAEDLLKSDRLRRAGCIIADMQMPHVSGLEMHRRLVGSGTSIPTILITAYPDDSVRTRALEAGIICYLTKPFSKNDLLACIHSALDRGAAGPSRRTMPGDSARHSLPTAASHNRRQPRRSG